MPTLKAIINGEQLSAKALDQFIRALSDPTILTEKGGYLFKSRLDGDMLRIGILPCILEGRRTYHYSIEIGASRFTLTGSFNANGTATILFRLNREALKTPIGDADRIEFRRQFRGLIRFLIDNGFPSGYELDSITVEALRSAGIADAETIAFEDIADWPVDAR